MDSKKSSAKKPSTKKFFLLTSQSLRFEERLSRLIPVEKIINYRFTFETHHLDFTVKLFLIALAAVIVNLSTPRPKGRRLRRVLNCSG